MELESRQKSEFKRCATQFCLFFYLRREAHRDITVFRQVQLCSYNDWASMARLEIVVKTPHVCVKESYLKCRKVMQIQKRTN